MRRLLPAASTARVAYTHPLKVAAPVKVFPSVSPVGSLLSFDTAPMPSTSRTVSLSSDSKTKTASGAYSAHRSALGSTPPPALHKIEAVLDSLHSSHPPRNPVEALLAVPPVTPHDTSVVRAPVTPSSGSRMNAARTAAMPPRPVTAAWGPTGTTPTSISSASVAWINTVYSGRLRSSSTSGGRRSQRL